MYESMNVCIPLVIRDRVMADSIRYPGHVAADPAAVFVVKMLIYGGLQRLLCACSRSIWRFTISDDILRFVKVRWLKRRLTCKRVV